MSVADTSLMAYRIVTALGITAKQQLRIIETLDKVDEPLTRSELEPRSGIKLSSVCAAVNALVKMKALVELPWRTCRVTKYKAHPLALPDVVPLPPDILVAEGGPMLPMTDDRQLSLL